MSAGSPIRPSAMVAANGSSWSLPRRLGEAWCEPAPDRCIHRIARWLQRQLCLVTWIHARLMRYACPWPGLELHPADEAVLTTAPPCSPIHVVTTSEVPSAVQVDVEDLGEAGSLTRADRKPGWFPRC